jgi:endonuclease/exonuclease/phosphatase family metal-dependent hydrolase
MLKKIFILLAIVLFIISCGKNNKLVNNDDDNGDSDTTHVVHSVFENMHFGTDNSFEIMTWNLKEFPEAGNTTVQKVAEALKYLSVDLVALQEIHSEQQFENVVSKLNDLDTLNTWEGYRSTGASYEINLAYIYKTNVIHKNSIYKILQSDGYALPRSPLVIDFDYDNINFIAIANHYKASGDNESVQRRREASHDLYEYINEHYANKNVIMLGDLNDELTDPPEENVFQIFLDDPQHYEFADMSIALGNSSDWSYPTWPSHIDHILITDELFDEFENNGSEIKTIKPDEYTGLSYYTGNISDHRPVALKLRLN